MEHSSGRGEDFADAVEGRGKKELQVPVPAEPVDLRLEVTVDDITLLVLEAPGNYDEGIAFPDPDPFLYLALDPSHPGDAVNTPDPDMVCAHHQICRCKHLPVPFFWQPDTYGLDAGIVHLLDFELVFIGSLVFRYFINSL